MAKVIITGWREGLKKVSLTKLQIELSNITLKKAHDNTNLLLDDIKIILEFKDEETALLFQKKADDLGANCVVDF